MRALADDLQHVAIGQEDLVDEVDVLDAVRDQPVEFLGDHVERPPAEQVAEIVLRAERAVVRAAARGLHLRAGALRAAPRSGGDDGGVARWSRAASAAPAAWPCRRSAARRSGRRRPCLSASRGSSSSHSPMITTSTPSLRRVACGRGGGVRPDGHHRARRRRAPRASVSQRHAQLRRRASPEQVARRGRDDGEVGRERAHPLAHIVERQAVELRVDDIDFVAGGFEQRLRVAVLQRQVRLAAAEVDAAVEAPGRINERIPHGSLRSRPSAAAAARPRDSSSHW